MKLQKPGSYIKAEEVEKGTIITFKDEGTIEVSDKYRYQNKDGSEGEFRKSLVFMVSYKGEDKKLRVNTASRTGLVEAWGDETKSWIGKSAIVHVLPTPNGGNKMIVLEPTSGNGTGAIKSPNDIPWEN